MKTSVVIRRTKEKIIKKKTDIKKLAKVYVNVPTNNKTKERSILGKMQTQKNKKNKLERLLIRVEKRKKEMPEMVWKRNKSHTENILANLDK